MKPIRKADISDMNGLIMDLPAFRNLKSKDGIHTVLNETLESIYINQPKELMEYMRYNLNEKMTETILSNYGIDKSYSKNINASIKRILVFYIERLFQTKGSREILGTFAEIFGNFFEKINFYNIIVDKQWTGTGFSMTYNLSPISIADKENIITHIDDNIPLSNKYLMQLSQYQDYKLFPINTNLIYIQFSGGISAMNNQETFTNGIRAYGSTALQRNVIEYPVVVNGQKKYIDIAGNHIELLIKYFQITETRLIQPDFDFYSSGETFYTELTYDYELLYELQDILHQYSLADYRKRNEMNSIKRRWQKLLRYNSTIDVKFKNYAEMDAYIRGLYPDLIDQFDIAVRTPATAIEFYMELYTTSLRFFDLDNSYLQLYVNTIFMQIITGDAFVDTFFNPVFEIFIKYFFPVEMEYLNELVDKMRIKDKWNVVSTEEIIQMMVDTSHFSLVTPQRGLDEVYTVMRTKEDPADAKIKDDFSNILIDTDWKSSRIRVQSPPIRLSYIVGVFDNNYSTDNFRLNLSTSLIDNISNSDATAISMSTTEQDIQETSDFWGSSMSTSEIDSVPNETKQIVKVDINQNDILSNTDSNTYVINYADYYTVAFLGDYQRNENQLSLKFGVVDYGYWESQQEQKYTYNKYLYFKSIVG